MRTAAATQESIPERVAERLGPIGPTIDKLHALRESKRKLEAEIKVIETAYSALEEKLIAKLDSEGTERANGKLASASISSLVVGNVTDWPKFEAFVKKTGSLHLFQRRLSDAAVRELFEQGKKIPGCEPFTKRRLNLRAGV